MNKTILNLLVVSLLLIFVAGCGGGGGDSVSPDSTNQNLVPTDPNTDPTDQNHPPVANAILDQPVKVGDVATLNGTGSYDPDGDDLTYKWEIISTPSGSAAVSPPSDYSDPTFSFTVDVFGEYTIQLVVTDSLGLASEPYEVVVSTTNQAPVANAIVDQPVKVNDVATLDGSGSSDPDENYPLTFKWEIISTPDGSAAFSSVSDSSGPTFSFTPDLSGEYTIQLVVTDSLGLASEPYEVVVSTTNSKPVADVGPVETVKVGDVATLDGSGSSDPDGDVPLTFKWEIISTPDGSAAVSPPSDYSDPFFSFTADLHGEYTIQLVVTDSLGLASEPYEVVVSTINSKPVADAGPDQELSKKGDTIQLDGSQSFDPDGDTITYAWSITNKPPYSLAVLNDPTAVNPTFVADSLGTYVIQLIVTDSLGLHSLPDVVMVSSGNIKPVADAGGNQIVLVGETALLDGSGSYDANWDDLTYSWNIASAPKNSLAELIGSETINPNFTAYTEGLYTISLVVNDGLLDSGASNVIIYAIDAENIDDFITALMNTVLAINGLDDSDFNNPNNRNALTSKIIVIVENYLKNGPSESNKLTSDIASHMDGCDLGGGVDQSDWIMNCDAQAKVYPLITKAIDILNVLNTQ